MAAKKSSPSETPTEARTAARKPVAGKPAAQAAPKAAARKAQPAVKKALTTAKTTAKTAAAKPAAKTASRTAKPAVKKAAATAKKAVARVAAKAAPAKAAADKAAASPVRAKKPAVASAPRPPAAAVKRAAAAKPKSAAPAPTAKRKAAQTPPQRKPAARTTAKGKALLSFPGEDGARTEDTTPSFEIEARKFEVGQRSPTEPGSLPVPRQLDDFYDETNLTLLVRDPHWIFAYWEIDAATRRRFLIPRGEHSGRLFLRWYDVTDVEDHNLAGASGGSMDVEINDMASSWYQFVPEADRVWCAELGVLSAEGKFLPICRSNVVRTPRATLAQARGRERWMHVSPTGQVVRVIETPGGMVPDEALLYMEGDEAAPDAPGGGHRGRRGAAKPGGFHKAATVLTRYKVSTAQVVRPISSGEFYETLKQESEELSERLARELQEQGKGPSSGGRP